MPTTTCQRQTQTQTPHGLLAGLELGRAYTTTSTPTLRPPRRPSVARQTVSDRQSINLNSKYKIK